ncbi:MAG TPA: YfhO family protein [Chloroflexota bacterium]
MVKVARGAGAARLEVGGAAARPAALPAWVRTAGLVGTLALLPFALTWRLWTPVGVDRRWITAGDFSDQFFPFARYVGEELRAGRLPLWNPYLLGGHPFQADPQTAVFYPPSSLLALLLGAGGLPYRALELELPLHFGLAAIGAFLLARRLTGDDLAGMVAGIAFGFGGFLTSYPAQQLAMLRTAAWTPLLLYALERAIGTDGRPVWLVGATAAAAAALLAGHSQTALFGLYLAAGYGLVRSRQLGRPWRVGLLAAAVPTALAVGLAALQLLPTLEFASVSTRDRLPYDEAAYGYELKALAGALLPGWRGEEALYVGVAALALALIALGGWRGMVRFWAIVAGLALVVSVGGRTFVYQAMYVLAPGWGAFRDQERAAVLWSLALAVLAAYGVARLRRADRAALRGWTRLLGLATAAAGLLAVEVLVLWSSRAESPNPYDALFESAVFLLLVLALTSLLFAGWSALPRPLGATLMVGLLVFDLFSVNAANNLSALDPRGRLERDGALAWARQTAEPYRLRADDDRKVPPNFGMIWRTPIMTGDSPIQLRRTNDLLRSREEYRLWQLFNVKYMLSGAERDDPALEPLGALDDLHVYRVRFSLPRAWAVSDVRTVDSPSASLAAVLDPSIHPGDVAIVEDPPPLPIAPGLPRPDVEVVGDWPNGLQVRVHSTGNSLLVVADAWHPGWSAYLDGRSTPILRTNHAFRGVAVPAGEHLVEMRFRPTSLLVGAALSALSALVALGLLLRWRGRPWGHAAPSGPA